MNYKLALMHEGRPQIIEYPYVEEEVLRHVEPGSHQFWKESVVEMYGAFPTFALVAGTSVANIYTEEYPHIFTASGVCHPITQAPAPTKPFYFPVWKGMIPMKVSGHPFFDAIKQRIKRKPDAIKQRWNRMFTKNGDDTIMMIQVRCAYGADRYRDSEGGVDPVHQQPWCWLHGDYWDILDIPRDHTYGSIGEGWQLCQYMPGREGIKAHDALKQRVVPRFVLDFALANIKALGQWRNFEAWMKKGGFNLHRFYNIVGKVDNPDNKEFLAFYRTIRSKATRRSEA